MKNVFALLFFSNLQPGRVLMDRWETNMLRLLVSSELLHGPAEKLTPILGRMAFKQLPRSVFNSPEDRPPKVFHGCGTVEPPHLQRQCLAAGWWWYSAVGGALLPKMVWALSKARTPLSRPCQNMAEEAPKRKQDPEKGWFGVMLQVLSIS